tara:strand:- start:2241 stop:2414 length:174 start_codon:yes stop_codon:yes gene_type:complete
MKPSDIELTSVSKNFEFEKLSRDIEDIEDVEALRNMLKCYVKLYFKQQETIASFAQM